METRHKSKKRKQSGGKTSSREFYYVGPPTPFQRRQHIQTIHTRGPLRNIQCEALDQKTQQQCKRQTVVGCGICWQHLKKLHQLRIKKSTILVDGKSIGKGLFAITTQDPEQILFENGTHIIDYVGEQLAEHEREERYGDGTGPYCIGGEDSDSEDGYDTPLIDCAFTRGVAALANHKSEPEANARYVFDEDRNIHTIVAIKSIHSGEEIFCDYGPNYQLHGVFAGTHDTLAGHRPPPKWYR